MPVQLASQYIINFDLVEYSTRVTLELLANWQISQLPFHPFYCTLISLSPIFSLPPGWHRLEPKLAYPPYRVIAFPSPTVITVSHGVSPNTGIYPDWNDCCLSRLHLQPKTDLFPQGCTILLQSTSVVFFPPLGLIMAECSFLFRL